MRYYFAGAYARRAELAARAVDLLAAGIGAEVLSRWMVVPQEAADGAITAAHLTDADWVARAWEYGQRDLEDLSECDAIVSFTGEGARGGRHIEHGVAISYHDNHPWDFSRRTEPIRLIVIGPREHVFHCHPGTEVYADFGAFLKHETDNAGH